MKTIEPSYRIIQKPASYITNKLLLGGPPLELGDFWSSSL